MNRAELSEAAADSLAILPVGSTEQHGPHLPTGTDTFQVDWIVRKAVERAADEIPAIICPTMPFGSSAHHVQFGATMSLGTDTLIRVMTDLCDSLVDIGFRRIFIVNGHGGNHEIVQLVARDVALRREVAIGAGSWWTIAWDELAKVGAHERGRLPGHAGWFETSLALALHPGMVSAERPREDSRPEAVRRVAGRSYGAELPGFWRSLEGVSDRVDAGDASVGRIILDAAADALAAALAEFHSETESLFK